MSEMNDCEDKEMNQLLEIKDNIFTYPTKNYFVYRRKVINNNNLYKNGFFTYYSYAIYRYYIKPYLIDNFKGAVISSFKFALLYIFVSENEIFSRYMDKLILSIIRFGKHISKMLK